MARPAVKDWTDWLRFRCTACGNCCRGTIVMLTDADVHRIVDETGMAPREFVRFFGEDELIMPKNHPFWIRFARRRAGMALRWRRGDRCMFLDRSDQCTIYNERPLACREHPFRIRLSEAGAVEGIRISNIVECPYELDGHLSRRQLARVSLWNERESDAYQKLVRRWNRDANRTRTRPRFMEFLGLDWNLQNPTRSRPQPDTRQVNPFG